MNPEFSSLSRYTVLRTVLVVACAFLITSLLFTPGYIDLTAPAHSDLYRYFLISEAPWTASTWLTPRPLMVVYLKLAGIFHTPGGLYCLLALPSLAFVAMLALIGRRISAFPLSDFSIFLFGVAAFGMSSFLPMYQYDYGGMLSGVLAAMAVYVLLPNGESRRTRKRWMWAAVLVWASLEAKPTYGMALLGVSFIAAALTRKREYIFAMLAVAFILVSVFVKDILLGSGFIQSGSTHNVYSVVIDIPRNLNALWFYIENAFTLPVLVAVCIGVLALVLTRQWKVVAFITVAAIGSSAPMALLVNRLWDIYAWFSSVIFAMAILLGMAVLTNYAARARVVGFIGAYAVIAVVTGLLLFNAGSPSASTEWTVKNQRYNRHVLDTLAAIEPQGEGRILFAGSRGPYQPLRNTEFVKRVYPSVHSFDVLARKNEVPWNQMASREFVNAVYPSALDLRNYDRVYVLSDRGSLVTVYSTASLITMPRAERTRILLCSEGASSKLISNERQLLNALDCLVTAEEFSDAIALADAYPEFGKNQPWVYFQLAKAYNGMERKEMAIRAIDLALVGDPGNEVFNNARRQFGN